MSNQNSIVDGVIEAGELAYGPWRPVRGGLHAAGLAVPAEFRSIIRFKPWTTGSFINVVDAEQNRPAPPTHSDSPTVVMVDLNDAYPTWDVLQAYLLPVAVDIKEGKLGDAVLVATSGNVGTRQLLQSWAQENNVPMYLAPYLPPTAHQMGLPAAEPAGSLTPSDQETLAAISEMGGRVRASQVAKRLGIQLTAANNRLSSLHRKGYIHRVDRPGRDGDEFVDPRFPRIQESLDNILDALRGQLAPDAFARTEQTLRKAMNGIGVVEPEQY
jgi:hypothetical protein